MKKIQFLPILFALFLVFESCDKSYNNDDIANQENSSGIFSAIDNATPQGIKPFILAGNENISGLKASPSTEYQLVFSDEFNGGNLDVSKWTKGYPHHFVEDPAGKGHVHNHQAWMADENAYMEDGKLVLRASDQRHPDAPYSVWQGDTERILDFQSGAVHSKGKYGFTYGYIEGSFKSSYNLGTWPAFWTLNHDESWPPEIDILEIPISTPADRSISHYYYHFGTWPDKSSFGDSWDHKMDLSEKYHVYGCEWTPTTMTFYFDGRQVQSYPRRDCTQGNDMYILINLACGGWPGTPPAGQTWPDYYSCDYVRVFQKTGETSTDVTSSVDMIGFRNFTRGPSAYVETYVTIVNQDGVIIPGATVHYTWSDAVSGSGTAVTDERGIATFNSPKARGGGNFTITVDDVVKTGVTYDPSQNREGSDTQTVIP